MEKFLESMGWGLALLGLTAFILFLASMLLVAFITQSYALALCLILLLCLVSGIFNFTCDAFLRRILHLGGD